MNYTMHILCGTLILVAVFLYCAGIVMCKYAESSQTDRYVTFVGGATTHSQTRATTATRLDNGAGVGV